MFDDLGLHDLGFLGALDLKTPHIWYSNAPVCAPARSALMTGRYPLRNGVAKNSAPLRASEMTIAAQLKKAGYRTGLTGKWHLGSTPDTVPNAHGFDYFYGFHEGCVDYYSHRYYWGDPARPNFHDLWRNREEIFEDGQYLTDQIADEAVQFIERSPGQPFFLYTAFNAVHYPMHAPKKYVERFPQLERERQMYAAMLAAADDGVGRIVQTLEQKGMRENTLIVLLGDNGATTEKRAGLDNKPATAGRNGPYRGYKFSTFDGGMHVPAAVNWKGKLKPGKNTQLLMTADLFPTFSRWAGVPMPTDRTYDGHDLWPVIAENARSQHEAVYWSEGPQLAMRKGQWKLVVNGITFDGTPAGQKPLIGEDAIFLSDVEKDPGETTNLRHQHPDVVDEMQTSLQQWRSTVERQ